LLPKKCFKHLSLKKMRMHFELTNDIFYVPFFFILSLISKKVRKNMNHDETYILYDYNFFLRNLVYFAWMIRVFTNLKFFLMSYVGHSLEIFADFYTLPKFFMSWLEITMNILSFFLFFFLFLSLSLSLFVSLWKCFISSFFFLVSLSFVRLLF